MHQQIIADLPATNIAKKTCDKETIINMLFLIKD